MAVSFNPMHYLRHAWENTSSTAGKACIVLFYSFLWINILGAAWSLYDATTGWECMYDNLGGDANAKFVAGTMKIANFWILGFMLYADRGGIKVWNVFMVWFFFLAQTLLYNTVMKEFLVDSCPDTLASYKIGMFVMNVWIALALIASFMEHRATPSGEESTPLVS